MTKLEEIEYVMALVIEFEKLESDDATKCSTFCSNPKTETIINDRNIAVVFESIYSTTILNIQKSKDL